MAIQTFGDQATADVAAGINTKHSRRVPQRVWSAAQRRLDIIGAARTIQDIAAVTRFKELTQTKPGYYSVWVNDQFRIIFRFENGDAYDVYLEGYDHTGRR